MKKICKKCGTEQLFIEFGKDGCLKDGHKNECNSCRRIRENSNARKKLTDKTSKICILCEKDLEVNKFKIDYTSEDKLSKICIPCSRDKENVIKNVSKLLHVCTKCNISKPGNEFPTMRQAFTTIYPVCKDCLSEKRHSEGIYKKMSNHKKEREKQDPTYSERINLAKKEKHKEDPRVRMVQQSRSRSRIKFIEHSITIEDLSIPSICPILQVSFVLGTKGNYEYTPSLDRIDNTKGYTKENIQIITKKANSMKNSGSPEELLKLADWIYKTFK